MPVPGVLGRYKHTLVFYTGNRVNFVSNIPCVSRLVFTFQGGVWISTGRDENKEIPGVSDKSMV